MYTIMIIMSYSLLQFGNPDIDVFFELESQQKTHVACFDAAGVIANQLKTEMLKEGIEVEIEYWCE